MRWKLLVITSLVAAVVGACGSYGLSTLLTHFSVGSTQFTTRLLRAEVIPLLTSGLAGVFVYRHTARRRKTQVAITVLASLMLFQTLIYIYLNLPPVSLGGD